MEETESTLAIAKKTEATRSRRLLEWVPPENAVRPDILNLGSRVVASRAPQVRPRGTRTIALSREATGGVTLVQRISDPSNTTGSEDCKLLYGSDQNNLSCVDRAESIDDCMV